MSKIKPKRAFAAEHFDTFDGLGGSRGGNRHFAASLSNFRITADGSLKKRGGYSQYLSYPAAVRAFWEGTFGTIRYRFAVCGSDIYNLDEATGEPVKMDTVSSPDGDVCFFEHEGDLYLLDGDRIRTFYPAAQGFPAVEPYIPLYGRNWDPVKRGSLNEPFNILTGKIRVHYENPGNATSFTLPFSYTRILGVRVNGVSVTDYTATAHTNVLTLPASSTGYYVEIAMETNFFDEDEDITTARRCALLTAQQQNTLILYGTDLGYRAYPSSPVDSYELYCCRQYVASTKPLYFKEDSILSIGDRDHPLYSLCRYGSNMLAYCGLGTWTLNPSSEKPDAFDPTPILSNVTSTAPKASIVIGEEPILVNPGGIFRLTVPSSDEDLPRIEKISDPVEELLTSSFFENACAWENKSFGEIWFCDLADPTSPVLVYQYRQKQWYRFDNIYATAFIDTPEGTLFLSGNNVFKLDEELHTDNGEEIVAYYQSGYFSFSHPEAQKRALRMVTCAKIEGGECYILLESESSQQTFRLEGAGRDAPDYFDHRVLFGRFRFLRFRILMGGTEQNRIHSISFYANL